MVNTSPQTAEKCKRTRAWERRKEHRPGELLDAALEVFVARGYAAARLDDVAARAGVSKGTLYLYYAGKEDLFKAVVRVNIVPVIEQFRQRIEQATGSNEELLTNVLTDWWHCFSQPHIGGIIKLIIAEASNFPEIARFFHEEVMKLIWAHSMTQCGVPQLVPCGAEFIHHHVALILSLLRTPGTGLPGSSASAGDTTCLAPAGNPALPAHGAGPASPRTASDDRVASPAATSASAAAAAGTILWPSGHTCIPPCLQGHTPASREHTPASREHTPASREHASAPQEHTPASRGLSSTTAPGISGPTGHSRPAPTQPTPTQPT